MRVYNRGRKYMVTVTFEDIEEFRRRWPALRLPRQQLARFFFDKSTGALVSYEMEVTQEGQENAIRQLARDARTYGARRLGVTQQWAAAARALREGPTKRKPRKTAPRGARTRRR